MSVSLHIEGYQEADDRWNKMKLVWDQCDELCISIPDEVISFFGGKDPGDKPGQTVELGCATKKMER